MWIIPLRLMPIGRCSYMLMTLMQQDAYDLHSNTASFGHPITASFGHQLFSLPCSGSDV